MTLLPDPEIISQWKEIPALAIIFGVFVYMWVYMMRTIPKNIVSLKDTVEEHQNNMAEIVNKFISRSDEQHTLFKELLRHSVEIAAINFSSQNSILNGLDSGVREMNKLLVELRVLISSSDEEK
jgi:hypothetical protein